MGVTMMLKRAAVVILATVASAAPKHRNHAHHAWNVDHSRVGNIHEFSHGFHQLPFYNVDAVYGKRYNPVVDEPVHEVFEEKFNRFEERPEVVERNVDEVVEEPFNKVVEKPVNVRVDVPFHKKVVVPTEVIGERRVDKVVEEPATKIVEEPFRTIREKPEVVMRPATVMRQEDKLVEEPFNKVVEKPEVV